MQSKLEAKAITKRTKDTAENGARVYGVTDNKVTGNDSDNEYDINGEDAKKGGDSSGSLVDHLHKFDFTTGGDVIDARSRATQLAYAIPDINKYTSTDTYSDADAGDCSDANYGKIDTSLNVGQVIIY
jgi:hypothetical protein